MKNLLTGALGAAFVFAASVALAQGAPPTRLRGTIEKVDGDILSIKTRDGQTATLKLGENYSVAVTTAMSLSDIHANSYIGVTAMPTAGGGMKAVEVHIFPEAQRGAGEGFRDWDLMPKSTMTNAAVTGSVDAANGRTLTLTYKGGEKKIDVPEGIPIVGFAPGSKEDVKAGAGVAVLSAEKLPDGSYKTARITVGRGGVNPPM